MTSWAYDYCLPRRKFWAIFNEIHHQKTKSSEIIFLKSKKLKQRNFDNFISNLPKKHCGRYSVNAWFCNLRILWNWTFDEENPRYFILLPLVHSATEIFRDQEIPFRKRKIRLLKFSKCAPIVWRIPKSRWCKVSFSNQFCPNCGIQIWLKDNQGNEFKGSNKEIFEKLAKELSKGKIVANQKHSRLSINLRCHQFRSRFRVEKRKRRPTKPFAVLFSGISTMQEYLRCQNCKFSISNLLKVL